MLPEYVQNYYYNESSNEWVKASGSPDGSMKVIMNGASVDAFARARVSNPKTLFDSKQLFDNLPLLWDDQEVSGSGTTSTHSTAKAATTMGVANLTAGKRVRQTFMRFNYQPGKSQLVIQTAVLSSGGGTGLTACVGQFDDDNGIFFCSDDGVLKAVIRSSTSGSPVDNAVAQANWNIDKMDGTGSSGVTLDPTKTNIMFFDYEWLGVGTVRMGFFIDGSPIYVHKFHHANNETEVYMSTPNLPLRYSVENDGTGAAMTMDHICCTVISEGGSEDLGVLRYTSTDGTHVDANSENTVYAIMGIRLKSTHLGTSVKLKRVAIQIQTGAENGEWTLRFNPTVASTFTYADETNSAVQIATGVTANTVTGGTSMDGGFAESSTGNRGSGGGTESVENAILLGSAINGTPDEFVLCWMPTGGTDGHDVEGSIHYRELS